MYYKLCKGKKTWEGSADFWDYLSTPSQVEAIPYFTHYWERRFDKRIASGESARRYFSTKEFMMEGVPNVFVPKTPLIDNRFFDPLNTWYIYDNKPLSDRISNWYASFDFIFCCKRLYLHNFLWYHRC